MSRDDDLRFEPRVGRSRGRGDGRARRPLTFLQEVNRAVARAGGYAAMYRTSATQPLGRLVSSEATADTGSGNAIYGANSPAAMVFVPDNVSSTTNSTNGAGSAVGASPSQLDQVRETMSPTRMPANEASASARCSGAGA
jgi:hypothetical protein